MISIGLFAYILFLHYLGDYIFQPYSMSVRKSEDYMVLLYHTIIYTGTIYAGLLLVVGVQEALLFSTATFVAHYVVDFITSRIISDNSSALRLDPDVKKPIHKRLELWGPISLLGFDQLLHQACLLIAADVFL
jgi:hypothetical protein